MKDKRRDPRILFSNNVLYIEKYIKIINISSEVIELEKIIIKGIDIHITSMDKYTLIVEGKIEEIRRKKDEHL